MRNLVSFIALFAFMAAAQSTEPTPEQVPVIDFLEGSLPFTRVRVQNTIDGLDYLFTTENEEAKPSWSALARNALGLDTTDGAVSVFIMDARGRILIAARRTAGGVVLMAEAAIAARHSLPGRGELVPPPVERVEAQPRPGASAPDPCAYVRGLSCYKPGAPRRLPTRDRPASERDTWGAECTSYQYGNTTGVRCRSW